MLGAAQVQVPLEHTSLVRHGLPQLPQFAGSLVGSSRPHCNSVMPFSGNVPTLHRTRSPNGGASVPCTRASEKSTVNCSARTSPPNVPAEVPIGSDTLPLSGPGGTIAGRYARTDAAAETDRYAT